MIRFLAMLLLTQRTFQPRHFTAKADTWVASILKSLIPDSPAAR